MYSWHSGAHPGLKRTIMYMYLARKDQKLAAILFWTKPCALYRNLCIYDDDNHLIWIVGPVPRPYTFESQALVPVHLGM